MIELRIPRLLTTLAALPLMLAVSLPAPALAQSKEGSAEAAPARPGDKAGGADRSRRAGPKEPAQFFARWDTDGDGKVALESLPERTRARLGAADTNGDGVLTRAEHQAFHAARQARFLAAADQDKDGKVSDAERAAYREARRAEGDGAGRSGPKGKHGQRDGKCGGDRSREGRGPQSKPAPAAAR